MKEMIKYVLFYVYAVSAFAQSQYLEAPPGDAAKNAEVSRWMSLANWGIAAFVAISVIICGLQAGSYIRQNEYAKSAGPIAGAIVIVIAAAWAVR